MLETELKKTKAILVSLCQNSNEYDDKLRSIDELERLCETADMEVLAKLVQSRKEIDRATYLGKGFMEDLKNKLDMLGADVLVFDNELSPSQSRNILKRHEMEAVDRTEIIISIFHKHAKSKEARLQVRLAELNYQLPRLKRLWSHLDRETGSGGNGTGAARGMGERQLEIDKRLIRDGINLINIDLKAIVKQNEVQRKQRADIKKVCIVGYTNAGKSTLFNTLTDAGVLVEDKLFATLDSTARTLKLEKGREIIISDTVGFISNLPHHLVASFRATLKEVVDADLLLHVVDFSDPHYEKYIEAVKIVLKEINALQIPQLLVFNKIDKMEPFQVEEACLEQQYQDVVAISAQNNINIDLLKKKFDEMLNAANELTLYFPFKDQHVLAKLHTYGRILTKEYDDNGATVTAIINQEDLYHIKAFIIAK